MATDATKAHELDELNGADLEAKLRDDLKRAGLAVTYLF